ncbi:WW domain-containing oxidoreductase isoform X1 [Neodiprion pinetum]|uniref:WW domain-containing oxidoreductase n=2 Tax=Neodiprion lecontei TaxID=441921 RepID=A0A6J0B6T2_NEOLC|nr:WW domain-containing oxidoreductase isoform X1 [Neodiprion lecontei]XP_046413558.1 WW domain-containing oxidoreductase isoform X1 [Neodiprion fabricii]XP_046469386.1 WW domain-containing oxidoreductase isoform X1 [Neodiprion pinetum]
MVGVMSDSDSEDELPPGWEERATLDGNVYYVNHYTKGTQWMHPRTGRKKVVEGELPPGWEKCISENGKVLFVDHVNRTTTYTDPRLAFATEYREMSQPIRQRFDASSTALSVLHGRDLKGKIAIITGANCGIGFETARSLALHGCKVILACRNLDRGQEAVNKIIKEKENVECELLHLDLNNLENVTEAASKLKLEYTKLDILILNAGVFGIPHLITVNGYESTFQTNHLAQFYFTMLLEPIIHNTENARIVVVSSESHRFSSIKSPDDIHPSVLSPPASSYWAMGAYNNSKLCNVLFAVELAKRWPSVAVFCLHPGNIVSTDISRHWWLWRLLYALARPFTKSLQQAASTSVFCATAPELEGATGIYFNNCYRCDSSAAAQDSALAEKLWSLSEEMLLNVLRKENLGYRLADNEKYNLTA